MDTQTETLEHAPPRRVAVLCPGPSLKDFPGRNGFAAVVAVNRAAKAVEADYWVSLDHHTIGKAWGGGTPAEQKKRDPLAIQGRPTLVCSLSTYRRAKRHYPEAKNLAHLNHQSIKFPRKELRWHRWGWATAVLVAAFHCKATEIECWGVDWEGKADFDGFGHSKMKRNDARWASERAQWGRLVQALEKRGIRVTRHPRSEAVA